MLDIYSNMIKKKQTLGQCLKAARERKRLTLRQVESATKISNAYLSQLEGDKIKQPSPIWLHKLAELYEVAYALLLGLAGYPVPRSQAIAESNGALAARMGSVTADEEDAIVEYLEFLRSRRPRGRSR
jgi:HTH-type transcriptional regulator, competence development regulator